VLVPRLSIPISIDTSKAVVARAALDAGAEIINDVTALSRDERMLELARDSRAGVCVMHMRGTPQTMQDDPTYDDLIAEVLAFLRERRDALVAAGIAQERIHNVTLCGACHQLHELGCPVLVGPSRKAFIGKVIGDKQADRTAGTIGVVLSLAAQGVQIVRVHDVTAVRQSLALFEATGGFDRL
jgi:dihydropteroate synthase